MISNITSRARLVGESGAQCPTTCALSSQFDGECCWPGRAAAILVADCMRGPGARVQRGVCCPPIPCQGGTLERAASFALALALALALVMRYCVCIQGRMWCGDVMMDGRGRRRRASPCRPPKHPRRSRVLHMGFSERPRSLGLGHEPSRRAMKGLLRRRLLGWFWIPSSP
eukprot:scaffold647_cov411-Prasinococcus_capsulatus_cf.AAC.24